MLEEILKLHQSGQLEEAEQQYREWLAFNPDDPEALHLLAILRRQRGELGEALELASKAVDLFPDKANYQLTLAGLWLHAREFERAREGFSTTLRLEPNAVGAALGVAQVALLQGDLDAAQEALGKAERLAPDHPQMFAQRGALAQARGDHDSAVKLYLEAAKRNPNDPAYQANLARSLEMLGNLAFAEQALRNAVQLKPDFRVARIALAQLLLRQGRVDDSLGEFEQVLAQQPDHPLALAGRGDIRRGRGDLAGALADYRQAHAAAPTIPDMAAALVETLLFAGSADEARAILAEGLAAMPRAARLRRLDVRLAARGGPQAHLAACRAWVEADPASLEAQEQLAGALELAADYDAADGVARTALARDSRASFARLALARSALRAGRPEEAQEQLNRMPAASLAGPARVERAMLRGLARDALGDGPGAVEAWLSAQQAQERLAPLTPLVDVAKTAASLPDAPSGDGEETSPVFVAGLPGSGVQMLAALLRHHGVRVVSDRFGRRMRGDALATGEFATLAPRLREDPSLADGFRDGYLAGLAAIDEVIAPGLVDWLPFLDLRMMAVIQAAFPAARFVFVERDLRDCLLSWLALGTPQALSLTDPAAAGSWLASAHAHWTAARERIAPGRLCVVRSDELADPARLAPRVCAFLGVDAVDTGHPAIIAHGRGGLPVSLPDGRWQAYAEVLAPAFAPLAPAQAP